MDLPLPLIEQMWRMYQAGPASQSLCLSDFASILEVGIAVNLAANLPAKVIRRSLETDFERRISVKLSAPEGKRARRRLSALSQKMSRIGRRLGLPLRIYTFAAAIFLMSVLSYSGFYPNATISWTTARDLIRWGVFDVPWGFLAIGFYILTARLMMELRLRSASPDLKAVRRARSLGRTQVLKELDRREDLWEIVKRGLRRLLRLE